jgi:hypothetical protein
LTIVFESARSFWLNVSCLDHGPERVESGLRRLDPEHDAIRALFQVDADRLDDSAIGEEPNRGGLGDARGDLGHGLDLLAEARGRRCGQPIDEHLVPVDEPDDARLHLDPARRRECGLALAAAGGVVAVRDEHDPLLRRVGEQRRREAQRGVDVGRGLDRRAAQLVDRAKLLRQPLDQRVLAEGDDARLVALGHDLQRLAQERERVRTAALANAVREVHDEDGREPIDGEHELDPGEGDDEGR